MRFSRLLFCATLAVPLYVTSASSAFADHVVRCESKGFKLNHCPADTRGGVELRRQLSDTDCRRGQNWGYDHHGIWVDHGCAGEFAVGHSLSHNDYRGRNEHRRWEHDRYGD